MPPLDFNLAIWDAENAKQIEVNRDKDRVKLLVTPEKSFDSDLASKIIRLMQQHERNEINIPRGWLNSLMKDRVTGLGYPWHDYLMTLQYLIDSDQIEQQVESVPKALKRPYHKFVFLQFPGNPNEDWNRNEINKWIANWNKKK